MPKTGELHIQESPDTPGHDGHEEDDMLKEKQAKAHVQGPLQLLIITNPALVFRSRTALSCLDVISAQRPMCYFSGGQTKGSLTASREASSATGVSGKERLPVTAESQAFLQRLCLVCFILILPAPFLDLGSR